MELKMADVLFIRVNDKGTIEHPIIESNLRELYPDLDINNPPTGFARFERTAPPILTDFRVVDKTTYELSSDLTQKYGTPTYIDVYHIRDMTEEEKAAKTQFVLENNLSDVPVYNEFSPVVETQPLQIPEKPAGNYIWDPYKNNWVNLDDLEKVFGKFFAENNLVANNFNMLQLSEEKQKEFMDLVETYKNLNM